MNASAYSRSPLFILMTGFTTLPTAPRSSRVGFRFLSFFFAGDFTHQFWFPSFFCFTLDTKGKTGICVGEKQRTRMECVGKRVEKEGKVTSGVRFFSREGNQLFHFELLAFFCCQACPLIFVFFFALSGYKKCVVI